MNETILKVEGLSKMYRIGMREGKKETIAATVGSWFSAPLRNFRKLQRLSNVTQEDVDTIWALKDVSFSVKPGEVLGIIGKNGSGKSTLLKVLSRITPPTRGRAEIQGRVASLLEVGTGFHNDLTGRENLYMNGVLLGLTKSEIDSKYDEIVEFAGVEKFMETPVKRYSSGMKVRLAFSVASNLRPDVLIIDEVLAVGDVEFQKKCLKKMSEIARSGVTILFVSHDMSAIKFLCTRAFLLNQGQIEKEGTTSEVIAAYLHINKELNSGHIPKGVPRKVASKKARYTKAVILDAARNPLKNIPFGQSFVIELELEILLNLKHAAIEVFICNNEGIPVSYISLLEQERKSLALKKGKYTFDAKVENQLVPGEYTFNLILRGLFYTEVIDDVDGVYQFTVLPDNRPPEQLKRLMEGVVSVNSTWAKPVLLSQVP